MNDISEKLTPYEEHQKLKKKWEDEEQEEAYYIDLGYEYWGKDVDLPFKVDNEKSIKGTEQNYFGYTEEEWNNLNPLQKTNVCRSIISNEPDSFEVSQKHSQDGIQRNKVGKTDKEWHILDKNERRRLIIEKAPLKYITRVFGGMVGHAIKTLGEI